MYKLLFITFAAMCAFVVIEQARAQDSLYNILDTTTCRYLSEYQSPQDSSQSADYVAGLDVHGRGVVPADIDEGRANIAMPERFEFDITVDAARYAGIPVDDSIETLTRVGTVTVENNRLYFNGEPLKPEHESGLIALCR